MSNPEADVRHETASDVIGNSRQSPEEGGGQPVADAPVSSIAQDQNDKNMPTLPKIDRTTKMTTHRPTRTSSAPPPEDHGADAHKAHFQPTKTQQSFLSSNDSTRRPYQYNQSGGRGSSPYNAGHNGSFHNAAPVSSRQESPAGGEATHASGASDSAAASSDASSQHTSPSEGGTGRPPAPNMHIQTGHGSGGPAHPHSPMAPLSPAMRSASGEHGSFHTSSSGQNSPAYPNNPAGRNFRNSPGFGPQHSSDRSPYNQGQNGPPGNYNNNMNREPYNNNRGDYREGGGRAGGRTTRRAPQGGSYGGRGPHMNMHEHGGGPMNMGPGPPVMNQQRGNFVHQPPPHGPHPSTHPASPQQQQPPLPQQQQQQWVQVDPYTGAQMITPASPQTGPGPSPGSPFQPANAAYPAGAPIPPGGRVPQPQTGGMQGMNNRGPPPHQNLPPQQQQVQQPLHHQAPMFVPQHGNQPVHPQHQQQQQQMMQQQNMMAQVHQQQQQQQQMFMHNQVQQQQYMPQQMYVPYEMTPEQVMMFEMQNQHNMQFQGMQNVQTMQVRGPNGQIMQVVHPASAYPMGMVPGQQMQTFPQQMPPQHMQPGGHAGHSGHAGAQALPHGQVHVHPQGHGAPQQVFVSQEMYAQQPQMVHVPMHMAPPQHAQGAAGPGHLQPGMMHMPVQVPPGASYNNYPPAVTGMHMQNAQHYNPNMGPQYGPQGGHHMQHQHNNRPPHPNGPHDPQGPVHGQGYGPQGPGPHQGGPGPRGSYQKSPLPPRDHHNNNNPNGPPSHGPPPMASLPGPHHAHPPSPSTRYNQSHAAPHAPTASASGTTPATGAPASNASAPAVASGAAGATTGVTAVAPEAASATTAAPGASESAATAATSAGTEAIVATATAPEGSAESTPVKVNHTVVYPYQEYVPSQDSTPLPTREKKVLIYKKKDGSTVELSSFKDDPSSTSAAAAESTEVSVETAVAPVPIVPATTIGSTENIAASERDVRPEGTTAVVVESSVAPPVVAVTSVSEEAHSVPASASTTASAMTSASVSMHPSPRVSPKTVPSPSTVPVASASEADVVAPSAVSATAVATPSATPSAPVSKRPSTTITVPTVEEQLKDLRIEGPSPVEDEDTGVMGALSPAIKSADLPVFIGTSTTTSVAAATVPEVAAVSSTFEPSLRRTPSPKEQQPDAAVVTTGAEVNVNSTATLQSRNKKASKKELLAKADASAASSELSAYETTTPSTSAPFEAPAKTPIVPAIKVTTPRSSAKLTAAQVDASVPDSWDDAEINVSPLVVEPSSAGIKESRSLRPGGNKSFNINLHQAVAVVRFSKAEILAMKPNEKGTNPLAMYGNIAMGDSAGAPTGQKASNWNKGARSDGRNNNQDGDGWKRDNLPPTPSSGSKHKKQHSNVPMPKKIISNQMELLTTETMAILNKITPQTFEKLSQNMLALNVQNIEQMSKVIELIFEKAVQEQGFANLYAELCAFLNAKATHWEFYEVFKVVSSPEDLHGEFFWVRECTFPAVYVGPFFRPSECVSALQNVAELPAMAPVNLALDVIDLWLLTQPDLLVKVYRNEKTQGYYVTYMPFEDYGAEMRSQHTFVDYKAAQKDAKKLHYFRAKLVTNCQTEFQQSTMNESVYSELEEEKRALVAAKSTLSEAEFFYKSADIDDRRLKLKRRMLGNIRFVGELFKQKLLTDVTILDCISDLMGTPEQWKSMQDEQDIECLCHLLRTAGERLEAKFSTNEDAMRNFNRHFDRLRELSKDKTLNSRMRFALEEVLALRANDWQKRGSTEGPAKIADLHRAPHPHGSPMLTGRAGPGGPKGGPQPHHGQPPQQPQHPRVSILPRSGRGQQQDARRGEDKFGRTVSVAGHEGSTQGREFAGGNRPQPGDALRRVHSEYSPPVSGTATPTSTHSAGSHGGHHSTSGGHTSGPGHVRNSSVGSIAAEIDYSDPKMLNRAKSAISEYIEQKDHEEVILFLSEGPAGMYGYFVLQLVDKYLNESKEGVLRAVLGLLQEASLGEVLSGPGAQSEIIQALRSCETLKCLTDTTMDIKEAPERFASVLGTLLRHVVLTDNDVTLIMEETKVNCIEELGNSEEEWATVYARFTRQLAISRAPLK